MKKKVALIISIMIVATIMFLPRDKSIVYSFRSSPTIQAIAWRPNTNQIAVGRQDGTVEIKNTITGGTYLLPNSGTEPVLSLDWSADGKYIASGSSDPFIRIWDIEVGGPPLEIQGYKGPIDTIAWSPDGEEIASASSKYFGIDIWNPENGNFLRTVPTPATRSIAWNSDSSAIAAATIGPDVAAWDVTSGASSGDLLFSLRGHSDVVMSVAWNSSTNLLASASLDQTVRIWNPLQPEPLLYTLSGHTDAVTQVAWQPHGNSLASASLDGTVRVWDTSRGQLLKTFQSNNEVPVVAWSPNGNWIAYSDSSGNIGISIGDTLLNLPFEDNLEFSTSHWTTTGNWALDDTESHSTSHSFKDTRTEGSGYTSTLTLNWPLNLSEAIAPELTYWTRRNLPAYESGYVEVSTDEGVTWQPVRTLRFTNLAWIRQRVDLSAYVGQQIRLRFRLVGINCWQEGVPLLLDPPGPPDPPTPTPGDGSCPFGAEWWLDDIQVAEANPTVYSVPFSDDFATSGIQWDIGDAWTVADGFAASRPNTLSGPDNLMAITSSLELDGVIDLSGLVAPGLTYQTRHELASGDHGYVEVSTDNGTTWTVVQEITGIRSQWGPKEIDLTAYTGQTIRLRFRFYIYVMDPTSRDGWWIDDVSTVDLAHTLPFADNFFSGSDNWLMTENWRWRSSSPRYMFCLSYAVDDLLTLKYPLNVQGVSSLQLGYKTKYTISGTDSAAYVEVSTDGGQTWITVDTLTGFSGQWTTRTLTVTVDPGSQALWLRFRAHETSGLVSWYVDDVSIQ